MVHRPLRCAKYASTYKTRCGGARMRKVRAVLAATLATAIVGAVASAGSAGAATTGAGTSKASTSVLQVALGTNGSVLTLRLLGDDSQSTIDPKVSAPAAFTRLSP